MKKWMWGGAAALLLLIFGFVYGYRSIHEAEWGIERTAMETVTSATYMDRVYEAVAFNGEASYTIVRGEDAEGRPMIGWVSEADVHAEYAEDGVSEMDVRSRVMKQAPDIEILRVVPGKLEGVYAWEVLSKKDSEQGERYFYDYFRFRDGIHLDTYRLAVKP